MRTHEQAGNAVSDVFELLTNDHRSIRQLLHQIECSQDDRQREGLFARLVNEVEAHSQAEDDIFYTSVEGVADLVDRIDEARQEHDQIEALLEELDGLPVSGDAWLEKVREIRMLIEHHVGEEEERIFPLARQSLSQDEALQLGYQFLRTRRLATEEVSSERLIVTIGDSTAEIAPLSGRIDISGDFEQMNKKELYELARQRGIGGRSAMTRAELARALRSK